MDRHVGAGGAIVVGGHVNGLGLVRALAARGIPVAVVTTEPYDIAHRSRLVVDHDGVSGLHEQPERLVALLDGRATRWAGWAVFPANDDALAALSGHHDHLASTYRVLAPPAETASYFLDKARMLDVAGAVGVDLPRCYGPATAATAARGDIAFPVVVKPDVGYRFRARFDCKLFAAYDRRELDEAVARLAAHGLRGQVFDWVPGPDSAIYAYCTYLDARGEPCGGLTVRKLRQAPPRFGVARVAEVVADEPDLRDATIAMLRRIGFCGMASAEFKRDPRDGRFRFLEVNGRSVIYNALLRRAGLDLAGLAWSDQVCGRSEAPTRNGWPGVWVNLHADLLYSLLGRGDAAVTFPEFVAPYRRPTIDAVWSAKDPLPFVVQWARTARAGIAALGSGTHRRLAADRTRVGPALDGRA
jgi:predicted ATP-grasp superfamily ATP-dependent carboligase